jgi:glycosyltransferase involved in cell wall biosynthesis
MKVTFVMRPDGNLFRGGAELMIERLAAELTKLNVSVEILTPLTTNLGDVVCLFGGYDSHWSTAAIAMERGIPYVWMPIFSSNRPDLSEKVRGQRQRLVGRFPRLQRKLMQGARTVIVMTTREARRLQAYFGMEHPRVVVIPHGVDSRFATGDAEAFRRHFHIEGDFIFHCGAYSHTKNQLHVVKALNGSNVRVVFAGNTMDAAYLAKCKAEATECFTFLDPIPHDSPLLPAAYAAARAFVLPSYNEAFSLAVLEAAVARCPLVLGNRWEAEEVYGADATYVDPDSPAEIKTAALEAYRTGKRGQDVTDRYLSRYSWESSGTAISRVLEEAVL